MVWIMALLMFGLPGLIILLLIRSIVRSAVRGVAPPPRLEPARTVLCPFCREAVAPDAVICPHCRSDLHEAVEQRRKAADARMQQAQLEAMRRSASGLHQNVSLGFILFTLFVLVPFFIWIMLKFNL